MHAAYLDWAVKAFRMAPGGGSRPVLNESGLRVENAQTRRNRDILTAYG